MILESFLLVILLVLPIRAATEIKAEERNRESPFEQVSHCTSGRSGNLLCTGITKQGTPFINEAARQTTQAVLWQTKFDSYSLIQATWVGNSSLASRNQTSTAAYSCVSTLKRNLGYPSSIVLIADDVLSRFDMLAYDTTTIMSDRNLWGTNRTYPYPNGFNTLSAMSTLDNRGGIYIASTNQVLWYPLLQTRSLDAAASNETQAVVEVTGQVTSLSLSWAFDQLYVLESNDARQRIWKVSLSNTADIQLPSQPFLVLDANSNPPVSAALSSIDVHPSTNDVYVSISTEASSTLVFNPQGTHIATIKHNFKNVRSIDIDPSGQYLMAAGDNGDGNGRFDFVDLTAYSLAPKIGSASFLDIRTGLLLSLGLWVLLILSD